MMQARQQAKRQEGSALVAVMLLVIGMAALAVGLMSAVKSSSNEQGTAREELGSLYVAEAAIAEAVFDLGRGGDGGIGVAGNMVAFGTGGSFWVNAAANGAGQITLTATGEDAGFLSRIEVIVEAVPGTGWTWGAFGDESMSIASNARVDSYDSRNGTYASQAINGGGANQYASANGDIGSNGNVSLDQNAQVWGAALPGPTGATSVLGNAVVTGSTLPLLEVEEMPALTIPAIAGGGSITVSTNQVMPSGDHRIAGLTINNNIKLVIIGPARVVIDDFILKSGANVVIDATAGGVEFYILEDFVMSSNTLIASTTFDPADVQISLESDNILDPNQNVDLDEIDFNSNAQVYGTIYAPNASVAINSNFELFGGIVARRLHLDSNATIHYDEALGSAGANGRPSYQTLCWRVLAPE